LSNFFKMSATWFFGGSSVQCPAMGADHPLPLETLPTQNMICHRTINDQTCEIDHEHQMIISRFVSHSNGYGKRMHTIDRGTFKANVNCWMFDDWSHAIFFRSCLNVRIEIVKWLFVIKRSRSITSWSVGDRLITNVHLTILCRMFKCLQERSLAIDCQTLRSEHSNNCRSIVHSLFL